MAIYAIGDVQGCFQELQQLLALVAFDPVQDQLWFAGDLVNRGPDSLAVLRFVKQLDAAAVTVLGNHDLHLLALAYGERQRGRKDASLQAVLDAPDADELVQWLRQQPLLHQAQGFVMTHAGIPPQWSVEQAAARAAEVEQALRGPGIREFLHHMYGDEPDCWHEDLQGQLRLRVITNYLTRMRALDAQGRLNLGFKESVSELLPPWQPWFAFYRTQPPAQQLLFGHWAALNGRVGLSGIHGLDTGCVWGGQLTALRLDDLERFQVPATLKPEQLH